LGYSLSISISDYLLQNGFNGVFKFPLIWSLLLHFITQKKKKKFAVSHLVI